MALYKMSELAPLALAEINEIIRLAELKEKLTQCAGRDRPTLLALNAQGARGGGNWNFSYKEKSGETNKLLF